MMMVLITPSLSLSSKICALYDTEYVTHTTQCANTNTQYAMCIHITHLQDSKAIFEISIFIFVVSIRVPIRFPIRTCSRIRSSISAPHLSHIFRSNVYMLQCHLAHDLCPLKDNDKSTDKDKDKDKVLQTRPECPVHSRGPF